MTRSPQVIAAIDQGTTSTRCMLVDRRGRMVALAQREHRQHYPRPGWVEHDATEIWRNVGRVVRAALDQANLTPADVAALGIANQRETTIVWDPHTGKPLAPAITWQDTRTAAIVEGLVADGHEEFIRHTSGLPPATYFAGPRLAWLLEHVPGLRQRAESGNALFGTMESWLIWNLSGGVDGGVHVTDVTNASRTLCLDIEALDWNADLLALLGIPPQMLPKVVTNAEVYAHCSTLLHGVPIAGALGDQQAALVGQTCFDPGAAKCTYGTGAFLLLNTGSVMPASSKRLLRTVGYVLGDEPPVYALEGSIAVTGSLVQWLRDSLQMIPTAPQVETLARSVEDNGGCYVVPAFSGLYAPHWRPEARGTIVGLTSYVTRGHIARAVLEATAWQTYDVVEAMNDESGLDLTTLRVDGGMTANHLLMQYVADVLDVPVERPLVAETVSLGAAYAAGLTVGYWADLADLRRHWHRAAAWTPEMEPATRRREARRWKRAVERSLDWVQDDED